MIYRHQVYENAGVAADSKLRKFLKKGETMKYVYVLNDDGTPLAPTCRCGHVRKLLISGKAKPVSNAPFTIKLKYHVDNPSEARISEAHGE